MEDRSNQIKDLLTNAKVEIEDYKGILSYYREIEESLLKTKEALKHAHVENLRLKENNEVFESIFYKKIIVFFMSYYKFSCVIEFFI